MQRESYWDYMGRRMREESNDTHRAVVYHDTHRKSSSERELNNLVKLFQRVEQLERKVRILGGDPKQLEMDI